MSPFVELLVNLALAAWAIFLVLRVARYARRLALATARWERQARALEASAREFHDRARALYENAVKLREAADQTCVRTARVQDLIHRALEGDVEAWKAVMDGAEPPPAPPKVRPS